MRLDEYATYDASGLARLLNSGEVTPIELVRLAHAAHDRVNGRINAVIEFYQDAETIPVVDSGVFRGIPFLRKDLGAVESGRLQERGSRLFKGNRPTYDSHFFKCARSGGLRTVGRTTTPEFGVSGVTESFLTGITRNPWDPETSPGGSSGGSAAAVAAGIVPMAHGGDGGGSIRTPACFTGLVGLNPSRGRISGGPDRQDTNFGLARHFVLCRSVRDMAIALNLFAGAFPGDPFVIRQPERAYADELKMPTGALKVGLATTKWGDYDIEPDVLAAVMKTAKVLEGMGHVVREIGPPCSASDYVEILLGMKYIGCCALDEAARKLGRSVGSDTVEPVNLKLFEAGRDQPLASAGRTFELIRKMRVEVAEATADFDVLLTPCMPMVSMPHGQYSATNEQYSARSWMEMDAAVFMFLGAFNVTGQPAVSLPLAESTKGLPIGVQLVGRFGDEATLIRLARDLEVAMPWAERRPSVHAANL